MTYRLMRRIWFSVCLLGILLAFDFIPAQAGVIETYFTTQPYDGGLMLWRSDNHDVWVFVDAKPNDTWYEYHNSTGPIGTAYKFVATYYNQLSKTAIAHVPASRIKPMSSFGVIWNNLAYIRTALGYPVLPEMGFGSKVFTSLLANESTSFLRLDGMLITVYRTRSGYRWYYDNTSR